MFFKICNKPFLNNGKCTHCRDQQKVYTNSTDVTDKTIPSSKEETETLLATLPSYVANNYEQNQVVYSENLLVITGMILAICSLFFTMLAIPSYIVSVIALVKANSLNGAGAILNSNL